MYEGEKTLFCGGGHQGYYFCGHQARWLELLWNHGQSLHHVCPLKVGYGSRGGGDGIPFIVILDFQFID